MAIFGPKPQVNPFRKMSIFRVFKHLVFIAQKKVFFVLEYSKRHISGLYYLKKKLEKWAFLSRNQGLTPLEKYEFFNILNFFLFSLERRFFVLEYLETHFPGLDWLKKKLEKWPFLDQNYGLTPFENVNFLTLYTSCSYSPERRFFVLEYRKRYFLGLHCLKKEFENLVFLDQNHGLTPLERCQFFDILNFFFLQPRKAFSRSNPFGKMSIFGLCDLVFFGAYKGVFSF